MCFIIDINNTCDKCFEGSKYRRRPNEPSKNYCKEQMALTKKGIHPEITGNEEFICPVTKEPFKVHDEKPKHTTAEHEAYMANPENWPGDKAAIERIDKLYVDAYGNAWIHPTRVGDK